MNRKNILYAIICLTFFNNFCTGSNIANLVVIYDEDEGIVSDSQANAIHMHTAFKSQASPILLPGNLALRAAVLINPPTNEPLGTYDWEKYEEIVTDAEKTLQALEASGIPASKNQPQRCEVQKKLITEYHNLVGIFEYAFYFGKSFFTPPLLGQTTTMRNLSRELRKLINRTNCTEPENPPKLIDIDAYAHDFFEDIHLSDWLMFKVLLPDKTQTPQHFILFVPIKYAKSHDAFDGYNTIDLEKLGFDQSAFEQVDSYSLAQQAAGYDFPVKKLAPSIKRIFDPTQKAHVRWNIYTMGHGSEPQEGTPITYLLSKPGLKSNKDVAYITGMPAYEFLAVLDMWTLLPVNIVVYETCYGGGRHAEAMKQLLAVAYAASRQKLKLPTIVSIASAEESTYAFCDADFATFFETLRDMYSEPEKTPEQQKELLQKACKAMSKEYPIVLFQSKTTTPNVAKFESVHGVQPRERLKLFISQQTPELQEQLQAVATDLKESRNTFTRIIELMTKYQVPSGIVQEFVTQNFDAIRNENMSEVLPVALRQEWPERLITQLILTLSTKDITKLLKTNWYILATAIEKNKSAIIKLLLDGATKEERMRTLKYDLVSAIQVGNTAIIEQLLAGFTQQEIRQALGPTIGQVLAVAIKKNEPKITALLLDGASKEERMRALEYALVSAIQVGNTAIIEQLLAGFTQQEIRQALGPTIGQALAVAIEKNEPKITALLLDGASKEEKMRSLYAEFTQYAEFTPFELKEEVKQNPLYQAIVNNNPTIIQDLVAGLSGTELKQALDILSGEILETAKKYGATTIVHMLEEVH